MSDARGFGSSLLPPSELTEEKAPAARSRGHDHVGRRGGSWPSRAMPRSIAADRCWDGLWIGPLPAPDAVSTFADQPPPAPRKLHLDKSWLLL